MNIKEHIRKVLKEETLKDTLQDIIDNEDLATAVKLVGGAENLVNILYDGDIKQFYKENNYVPFKISNDGMSMYIDDLLVHSLNLEDWSKKEKKLGDFGYGPKDFLSYKLTARLHSGITSDTKQRFWKVVGISGDSGFGYGFFSKRNTLGKRARAQIFKQIIDKYDLNSYK
jgi:hypothetical protein